MIEKRTINGVNLLVTVLDPATHDIRTVHKPGATVKEIGAAEKAEIAVNFNFADTKTGSPIGRVIVGSKTVVSDITKTAPREELYVLPDGSVHIGKAPANAVSAAEGSPPLLRGGRRVVDEGIKRDQLGADIWSQKALRTAVGVTASGKVVIVRTTSLIYLNQLAFIMLNLGCVDALNGDGGGSSYLWPADNGWGRKLGSAIVAKRRETNMKLIAIDDGHGMETAGKRTPTLPDGTVMRENEFNRSVAAKLDIHLQRCGFRTLRVAPTDVDTPLQVRTDAANAAKAAFYISIHANAIGSGEWNGTRGIETFHYPGSVSGEKAARIIHRNLMSGTKLPDRGVKTANFRVLWETHMPAVLAECAFMTNRDDERLLLSDAYRSECAEELARAICEYFNAPYQITKGK